MLAQHPNAHAHNDYEHSRPLFDALRSGFTSIEADVHLVDDQLWVAHNRPISSSKTLKTLYLQPISVLIEEQGAIYLGYRGKFFLMIDIKTEAEKTYTAIEVLLQDYLHIIDTPLDKDDDHHPLKVFLSGNRAVTSIMNSAKPLASLDGRPEQLKDDIPAVLMPVVSESFSKYDPFTLGGIANPNKESKLRSYVNAVHAQGKKVRFWTHPDDPVTWDYLLSLGVDLINSDQLEELDAFLTERGL
jgi:hypothetical protein